jgi:hypothetical protein
MEGLGLQSVDRQILIENISIVFHAAANVRFDDDLKTAILSNTRSTRDICILAQNMTKLTVSLHELYRNIISKKLIRINYIFLLTICSHINCNKIVQYFIDILKKYKIASFALSC